MTIQSKRKKIIEDGKTYTWVTGVTSTDKQRVWVIDSAHAPLDGYLDMYAQLPMGDSILYAGSWPALWLMPANHYPWPYGVEIDILEALGSDQPMRLYSTIHYQDPSSKKGSQHASIGISLPGIILTSKEYHHYGMSWHIRPQQDSVRLVFYYDKKPFGDIAFGKKSNPILYNQFQESYRHGGWHVIIDNYIGTDWDHDFPTQHTRSPMYMRIRSLRVYAYMPT
jgi:hypothetical protein